MRVWMTELTLKSTKLLRQANITSRRTCFRTRSSESESRPKFWNLRRPVPYFIPGGRYRSEIPANDKYGNWQWQYLLLKRRRLECNVLDRLEKENGGVSFFFL